MVDDSLVSDLKALFAGGADAAKPEDALKIFEFWKQVAMENEDLKEELEDMDIKVQMVLSDVDKKFWVIAKEGKVEYGEGETENPSFTFTAI